MCSIEGRESPCMQLLQMALQADELSMALALTQDRVHLLQPGHAGRESGHRRRQPPGAALRPVRSVPRDGPHRVRRVPGAAACAAGALMTAGHSVARARRDTVTNAAAAELYSKAVPAASLMGLRGARAGLIAPVCASPATAHSRARGCPLSLTASQRINSRNQQRRLLLVAALRWRTRRC